MAGRTSEPIEVPELPSIELIEGFGTVEEAVAEREVPTGAPWRLGALVVGIVAAGALVVSLIVGGDDGTAAPTTTAVPATTAIATTIPPRTTLPAPASDPALVLPGIRPSARLTALVGTQIYQLDLTTGAAQLDDVGIEFDRLFLVDDVMLGLDGRELVRVQDDGRVLPLAGGIGEVRRGYSPASLVSSTRDGGGVVARILGPDGVFRAGARLPGEAVVYGALEDRLIVGLAGRVLATTGQENETLFDLGTGRVVGLGDGLVALLRCDLDGCRVVTVTVAGAEVLEVPLPEPLKSAATERWNVVGELSPSGDRLLVELRHGNGSVSGAVVVDLVTGEGQHSPELGVDFGAPAWGPESRFVVYPFDTDLFVWDVEALEGQLRSARAVLGVQVSDVALR